MGITVAVTGNCCNHFFWRFINYGLITVTDFETVWIGINSTLLIKIILGLSILLSWH